VGGAITVTLSVGLTIQFCLTRATRFDPSQVSEIEQDVHRLRASIRFVLNRFSLINKHLPPEILAMIPSFLRDRDRFIVTHVCRRWRDTFLSTPTLWDTISPFRDPDKTAAYLERSRGIPLNISTYGPQLSGWMTSFRMLALHSRRFGTIRLSKHYVVCREDVFSILENPLPRLTKLELTMTDGLVAGILESPHPFPPLKSLTLDGGMTYLQCFQPSNLRKLGVGCHGWESQLPSLLEFIAKTPLLEELEFKVDQLHSEVVELGGDVPPVALKHLQRIVFRGTFPRFLRSLTSHIIHPHHTKITLECHLPNTHSQVGLEAFPQGMQLPIPTPPKHIRYRVIHDEELSETSACIDLISVDDRHTLIENRYDWPEGSSLREAELWASRELDTPCLKFLQTIDLSLVERFCFERFDPNLAVVEDLMGAMNKLGTLVVVNGDPHAIFMAIQGLEPPNVICPHMRRLVVRDDLDISTQWGEIVEIVETRASQGFPLERVTLTSSFSEPSKGFVTFAELLETITEVRYDLGRSTFGWEWWKE